MSTHSRDYRTTANELSKFFNEVIDAEAYEYISREMKVFPVADDNTSYCGPGYALVAVRNNEVVAMRYLHEIDTEFDYNYEDDSILKNNGTFEQKYRTIFADPRCDAVASDMEALGSVYKGLLVQWQFIEL
jgi:hypothetical protein